MKLTGDSEKGDSSEPFSFGSGGNTFPGGSFRGTTRCRERTARQQSIHTALVEASPHAASCQKAQREASQLHLHTPSPGFLNRQLGQKNIPAQKQRGPSMRALFFLLLRRLTMRSEPRPLRARLAPQERCVQR